MLTQIIPKAGYLVAAIRGGKPVFADGFIAHTDTPEEAEQVADAWRGVGELVQVFALEPVEPNPSGMPPLSVVRLSESVNPLTGLLFDGPGAA